MHKWSVFHLDCMDNFLLDIYKAWADIQNREFERLGLDVQVSHESYAARGIKREPTKHLGPIAMAMELREEYTDRGDEYREVMARNRSREREIERQRNREFVREPSREFERSR